MRLNPDCIRDILLTVEEHTGLNKSMHYPPDTPDEYKALVPYSFEAVLYHVGQCEMSGLVTEVFWHSDGCIIYDLSPEGHRFLADIRNDTNWAKTKKVASEVGSSSLEVIKSIASSVISELISKRFGANLD